MPDLIDREALLALIDPDEFTEMLVRCGWKANPWVWVISFERIRKEETT